MAFQAAHSRLISQAERNIEQLYSIAPTLDQFVLSQKYGDNIFRFDNIEGYEYFKLWNNGDSASGIARAKKGCAFAQHVHEHEQEFFVTISGLMKIWLGDYPNPITLGPGDAIEIPPGIPHRIEFLEDTSMHVITVPAAPGFP